MTVLMRALLGVAAVLPFAAGAQIVRPPTPPPTTVMVPFPIAPLTVQFAPSLPANSPPPLAAQVQAEAPRIIVVGAIEAAPVQAAGTIGSEMNATAVSTGPVAIQPDPMLPAANVASPGNESEAVDADGEECRYQDENATGVPIECADNRVAAEPAAPAAPQGTDWWLVAFMAGGVALFLFWMWRIFRR